MLCAGVGGRCQSSHDGQEEIGDSLTAVLYQQLSSKGRSAYNIPLLFIYIVISQHKTTFFASFRGVKIFLGILPLQNPRFLDGH
jgi:hypothetical protein